MGILGFESKDLIEATQKREDAPITAETPVEDKKEGIPGLPKDCPEMDAVKSQNESTEFLLKNLNDQISNTSKQSDYHKAFLNKNMFATIRRELSEHQRGSRK